MRAARSVDPPALSTLVAAGNASQTSTPPPTAHTGWGTLVKDTAQDFVAFPKRKSTWVILAAGGAAALAAHPADDYVQEHIVGSETAKDVFRVLADSDALRPDHLPEPGHEFLTTGDPDEFVRLARRFLGPEAVEARPEAVVTA